MLRLDNSPATSRRFPIWPVDLLVSCLRFFLLLFIIFKDRIFIELAVCGNQLRRRSLSQPRPPARARNRFYISFYNSLLLLRTGQERVDVFGFFCLVELLLFTWFSPFRGNSPSDLSIYLFSPHLEVPQIGRYGCL